MCVGSLMYPPHPDYQFDVLDMNTFCLEKKVNNELKKLNLWLNVNRLSLNIAKTNYVIFHPYNKPLKGSITLKI